MLLGASLTAGLLVSVFLSVGKAHPSMVNYGECGKSERSDIRIVGGIDSSLGDWPWIVGLVYQNDTTKSNPYFSCMATLISNQWAITTAFCGAALKNTEKLVAARLGDLDLDPKVVDNASPVDEPIEKVILHPGFTRSPFITNNIALLRLKNSVSFTPNIRPICLFSGNESRLDSFYERKRPIVVGWDSVEYVNLTPSSRLQEATLNVINNSRCAEMYANLKYARIDDRIICAADKDTDACHGDGSGPLIFPVSGTKDGKNNRYFLGGMALFGVGCANPDYPGVYTRVAAFTDWISEVTGLRFD